MKALKKTFILGSSFALIAVLAVNSSPSTSANGTGAPTARTGSPGDGANCTACHTGSAASTVAGVITSDIPASGYVPGATYTITATIASTGINKFGFQISAQTPTGVKRGTMVITDASRTQLITSGKYITHKAAGTAGVGSNTWSFSWIAPVAGTGSFTFYGAFVLANGNNANSGDQVRLATLPVTEAVATGITDEVLAADAVSVYPNPATDFVSINVLNAAKADVTITDISGRIVKTIRDHDLGQNQPVVISELPEGIYMLRIATENGQVIKKIIKQ